ncbi:MAG TPA: DJ-1/PfpI family protein [Acidimicrobiales bacterium]|nr:DJ-1/PfpI family protein [Acidimicrobiales bacterium]
MEIAILLFDGITALDAVGPYEALAMIPEAHVRFVATERGAKRAARNGSLALVADHTLSEVPRPDVIVVPGGPGEEAVRRDAGVLGWLRKAHETSRWTTSVCTGSLTLAAAGFLDGVEATTHWSSMDDLAALGAKPVPERVVVRGKVITAAGVSAGIDMALRLAQLEAGDDIAMAIQLILEYDPQPPFDAGSPAKAPAHVLEMLQDRRRRRADS